MIDEVAGMMVAFFLLPVKWPVIITAFFLFRAFDMFKIYPVNKFEGIEGGAGVMMDDLIAGLYTNIVMQIKNINGARGQNQCDEASRDRLLGPLEAIDQRKGDKSDRKSWAMDCGQAFHDSDECGQNVFVPVNRKTHEVGELGRDDDQGGGGGESLDGRMGDK